MRLSASGLEPPRRVGAPQIVMLHQSCGYAISTWTQAQGRSDCSHYPRRPASHGVLPRAGKTAEHATERLSRAPVGSRAQPRRAGRGIGVGVSAAISIGGIEPCTPTPLASVTASQGGRRDVDRERASLSAPSFGGGRAEERPFWLVRPTTRQPLAGLSIGHLRI